MRFLRWIIVTVGVLVLTTVGINAFDNAGIPMRSLFGAAYMGQSESLCPEGMVFVGASGGNFCIDAYEASPGKSCEHKDPKSSKDTNDNLAESGCKPVSVADVVPWRNISRQQAELACARVEKRLPTNEEWYRAALGVPDVESGWGPNDCNVNSLDSDEPAPAGSHDNCVSPAGAYDMVGNVWEWLEETVSDGVYKGTTLTSEGYIKSINETGVPIETTLEAPDPAFFNDYFWLDSVGSRGILRGGYWKSKSDAGQYAVNITVPPSFVGSAVGFRCVKDVVK